MLAEELRSSCTEEVAVFQAFSRVIGESRRKFVVVDTAPSGHTLLLLNGSANRDERQFPDPDRFDIHRRGSHLSFGQGLHFCLGSALARMEARVALEEVLQRWAEWDVDYANAQRAHTASVRGWARLPVVTG